LSVGEELIVESREVLEEWARCLTAHDVRAFLELYTEGATYEDLALQHLNVGRQEIGTFIEKTFHVFPDLTMTLGHLVSDESYGSAEWTMSGTHAHDYPGLPAGGKRFSVRGCTFVELENGLIRHQRDYHDMLTFKAQTQD
jgi:steroid delta-isomerase-like uncharacterized protein